jgi:hypothetical protein
MVALASVKKGGVYIFYIPYVRQRTDVDEFSE